MAHLRRPLVSRRRARGRPQQRLGPGLAPPKSDLGDFPTRPSHRGIDVVMQPSCHLRIEDIAGFLEAPKASASITSDHM